MAYSSIAAEMEVYIKLTYMLSYRQYFQGGTAQQANQLQGISSLASGRPAAGIEQYIYGGATKYQQI
jgi:hypothetical protein